MSYMTRANVRKIVQVSEETHSPLVIQAAKDMLGPQLAQGLEPAYKQARIEQAMENARVEEALENARVEEALENARVEEAKLAPRAYDSDRESDLTCYADDELMLVVGDEGEVAKWVVDLAARRQRLLAMIEAVRAFLPPAPLHGVRVDAKYLKRVITWMGEKNTDPDANDMVMAIRAFLPPVPRAAYDTESDSDGTWPVEDCVVGEHGEVVRKMTPAESQARKDAGK